jgi:hypothetical protein
MPIKLPLTITLTDFKDMLREKPKKKDNFHFTGDDLKELGKDFWGTGKHLDSKFITPGWKFPTKNGQYHPAVEIYKRLVKMGRIIPPPSSPFAR